MRYYSRSIWLGVLVLGSIFWIYVALFGLTIRVVNTTGLVGTKPPRYLVHADNPDNNQVYRRVFAPLIVASEALLSASFLDNHAFSELPTAVLLSADGSIFSLGMLIGLTVLVVSWVCWYGTALSVQRQQVNGGRGPSAQSTGRP